MTFNIFLNILWPNSSYTPSALFFAVMALQHGVWTAKRSWLMAAGLYCQMINAMTNQLRSCHVMKCLVTRGEWSTPALPVEVRTSFLFIVNRGND